MPPGIPVPRPAPKARYRIMAKNGQVFRDWEELLRTRLGPATACWDHLAEQPREPVGGRYTLLRGSLSTADFQGQPLPQWQWEIERRARVKVAIGKDFVVILDVSLGHPKENE